jgi:hypothetical protein
VTQEFDLL